MPHQDKNQWQSKISAINGHRRFLFNLLQQKWKRRANTETFEDEWQSDRFLGDQVDKRTLEVIFIIRRR
ncbi:hypothetical protein NL64_02095 [Pseudomonas fluorescens]|nr:hypothetical protein NL64_02095 [Pseudomonas fluorescens]